MGGCLDKPQDDKQTQEGQGNGPRLSSMQCCRKKMKDKHCAVIGLNQLKDRSFFAVFDGHAGAPVAAHCAENLLDTIQKTDRLRENANTINGPVIKEQIESVKQSKSPGFLKYMATAICALISAPHHKPDYLEETSKCKKCGFSQTDNYKDSENYSNGDFVKLRLIEPKPGDLIQIDRGSYQHWVLYSGNGYVIHVTIDKPNKSETSQLSNSSASEKAYIREEKLAKVVGKYRCRINNLYIEAKHRNLKAKPVKYVLKSAHQNLDQKCHYALTDANCEHNVTFWKYGVAFSTQVSEGNEKVVWTATIITGVGAFGTVTGASAVALGIAVGAVVAKGGFILFAAGICLFAFRKKLFSKKNE